MSTMKHMSFRLIGSALFPGILLLTACSHTVEPHRPQAAKMAPVGVKLSPRQPQRATPQPSLPMTQPVESVVPITLTGDLTPLYKAVTAGVPESFDEKRNPLGADFRWSFKRQGEPQVTVQNGHLAVHAEYRGDIEARSTTGRGCRLDPVYPLVDWNARLQTKQDGQNLVLQPENPQVSIGLKPGGDDRCNMFAMPLKEQLMEVLNHEEIKTQIANAITEAGVAIPIHPVWDTLNGPYMAPVTSLNSRLCIYPHPSEVTVGPLEGTLQQAVLRGSAKVEALAVLQQSCEKPRSEPDKITSGPPSSPFGHPFTLNTMLPVPYQVFSQRLQEKLFHTDVSLPEEGMFGEKKMTIEKVSISEAGGNALITVETSGYVNGPIYYSGRPRLEGTTLTIPDLQMDTETRKMLDAEKAGLWSRVDQALKDKVRRAARIDLADQIAAVRNAAAGHHKATDLALDIGVVQVRPQQVYATAQGLMTDLAVEGTAKADGRLNVDTAPSASGNPTGSTSPQPMPPQLGETEKRRQELLENPNVRP